MRLGTASWMEGPRERRALVGLLEGDPGRVVDLARIERVRLAKLGEGRPDLLAEALVPPSLRQVLDSGPRGLQRVKQSLAYAEKWFRRGGLPEALAPRRETVRLLPCLPRPSLLRSADGRLFDRLAVLGSLDCALALGHARIEPALGLVGLHRGRIAGCCLALIMGEVVALGTWLWSGEPPEGEYTVRHGESTCTLDLPVVAVDATPSDLRPGEVCLFPFNADAMPFTPWEALVFEAPFDHLILEVTGDAPPPTIH